MCPNYSRNEPVHARTAYQSLTCGEALFSSVRAQIVPEDCVDTFLPTPVRASQDSALTNTGCHHPESSVHVQLQGLISVACPRATASVRRYLPSSGCWLVAGCWRGRVSPGAPAGCAEHSSPWTRRAAPWPSA
eukprot:1390892-Prymnesium_polylepis.1